MLREEKRVEIRKEREKKKKKKKKGKKREERGERKQAKIGIKAHYWKVLDNCYLICQALYLENMGELLHSYIRLS